MTLRRVMIRVAVALVFGSSALADEAPPAEAPPAEANEAVTLVTQYLQRVKAKKWADAKKLVHPKTLDAIAERKRRVGREDHPMAPQTYEKSEYYLKEFKVSGSKPGPLDTVVVQTLEDNYQVEEKGVAEGDAANYLVGRFHGQWYVVDKKRGGEDFTKDSVKYGYKGYFDPPDAG